MMPIYERMMESSYPHQRISQSEYQQSFPSDYIPLNPSNPPMVPHNSGNYTFPYPVPFNSCCNHGYFPGFHGPIPFCSQPQPLHHCPSQPFSAFNFPPPPHYSDNMAWTQDRHRFGRPFHESEERGLRVEEPARSGPLVPVRVKGYPYPVAWVPHKYARPLDETRVRYQKAAEESDEDPAPFFWVPRGGKEEEAKTKEVPEKSKDLENRLQFPVVWMPGRDTRVEEVVGDENEKEPSAPPQRIDSLPFLLKFLPAEKLGGDMGPGNPVAKEENGERAAAWKDVPVKPQLPPVCVDPLPKKKKKNGSVGSRSRSPIPPKQRVSVNKAPSNNEEPKEKVGDRPQASVNSSEPAAEREEVGKKTLSEVEAALRIQSAYRGYEIRRSQPLRKLKKISEVREQVAGIRSRIRALESSSDVRKDGKQRLIVGETIMRLLLQLDTIQGLLPSLRDVRKTLAKELVSLQEKLDSLVIEPENPELETCASVPVDLLSEKPEETLVTEPEKSKSETGVSGAVEVLGVEVDEVECKQEKTEETLVMEPEKPKSETYSSEPVNVLSVEAEEVKCKQEIHVIESEKSETETGTSGPVNALSVEAEEVKCKQETPAENPESGPVNVLGVEAEEVECKQEKQDSGPVDVLGVEWKQEEPYEAHVIESEEPRSETCDSGSVYDVLGVEAEEVESRQEKLEETRAMVSEKPESKTYDCGPVDVVEIESSARSFDVIESRQAPESERTFNHSENAESEGGGSVVPRDSIEGIENEKLREMMEKLLEAGERQLNVISGLSARVKDLERRLYSRSKLRTNKNRGTRSFVK